jgi:hypothetical protein
MNLSTWVEIPLLTVANGDRLAVGEPQRSPASRLTFTGKRLGLTLTTLKHRI